MALQRFDLAALESLDGGRVARAFAHALSRCVEDCRDRPNLEEARKLKLELRCTPVADEETGELAGVDLEFHVSENSPTRKSRPYTMRARAGGQLEFNDLAPDNPDQQTIDEVPMRKVGE